LAQIICGAQNSHSCLKTDHSFAGIVRAGDIFCEIFFGTAFAAGLLLLRRINAAR